MTGQAVVRQQFRHAWRPARPPHTIRVDEAIDAVGLAMFPDRWGTQPEFDRLPIFRVRGQLVHLEPIEAPGFRKVVVESTENLEPLALDFSAAYKAVRTALRRGVPAAYVTFDGRQRELRRELLYTQPFRLFGAGYVSVPNQARNSGSKSAAHSRLRVWINRKQFKEWLRSEFAPKQELPLRAQDMLVAVIVEYIKQNPQRFSRNQLLDLVRNWMAIEMLPNSLEDVMLRIPREAKGGRPIKASSWNPVKDRLVRDLRKQAVAPSQSGATTSSARR